MTAKENDSPGVIAKPPLICLGFLLLGLGLDRLWPVAVLPEIAQSPVGGVLIGLGVLVVLAAVRRFKAVGTSFHTHKPATAIISDGPYGVSRNPIYLGLIAIYLGVGVMADAGWVAVLLGPLLLVMHFGVITREERYLERKFGDEYLRYKAAVRRWI
ncbi:MAG: isoprenylcysteine carboxylmethyltransferase family protein [Proteobacteria bacterium]|nr:isoprenylcysteine carboxylmethyltransferase family protein [Pseudomonadota bacterium]